MSQGSFESPRRAVRKRNKPQKYGDFVELSPTKRKIYVDTDSSEEEFTEDQCHQKPTALFSSDDVEGQDMFKFKSRHTKLDLQKKVKAAITSSPHVAESPVKTLRKSFHRGSFASPMNKANESTPRHVKDMIKKRIIKEVDSESGESDFSDGSSDDFIPDGDGDDSDNHESEQSSASASESEEEVIRKPAGNKAQVPRSRGVRKPKDSEYIVTPDNYFMMNSSKKITTSDHTLARLQHINLNDLDDADSHISEEHRTKIAELNQSYEHLFDKWLYVLNENFNIVLYGIGSKRTVLQQFQAEKLQDFPCIVVNGFFPSLTMKSILEAIIIDLLDHSNVPTNIGDIVALIDSELTKRNIELFLIVHNIDGSMLRNAKSQAMLASISQIQNVHTIASIDHINAPLLWDHAKLSKYKFTWWDVTTFLPYRAETSFETALALGGAGAGALRLASLRSVLLSLTTNAKGIYNIIIRYQLENHKQAHYQGLPFKELYSKSREQFLVSSDLALRAQLTEFLDHKLVRMKRSYDGSENLFIPIDNGLLQQFLEEQDS
ncbi:hypothetical protein O0L34_g4592 [Tuta absoluta]|nr:hypothetical protein O0L34_g4592 [Tuta absoluta]